MPDPINDWLTARRALEEARATKPFAEIRPLEREVLFTWLRIPPPNRKHALVVRWAEMAEESAR